MVGERQAEVTAVFERTEHYRPSEPHWYLSLIGVEALHRNKGCGAALLQHQLRQCDREHLPAYLWSSNPLNTSLYERHGFEIVGAIRVGSSPSIFPIRRAMRPEEIGTYKEDHQIIEASANSRWARELQISAAR